YVLQLAIDGKIYIAQHSNNNSFLGVIQNPNIAGSGCNYLNQGFSLSPKSSDEGLPNFISSYFVQKPQQTPFTYSHTLQMSCGAVSFSAAPSVTSIGCAASGFTLLGTQWDFGDPASGAANTSSLNSPTHIYSGPGTYTPKLIYYYTCGGGTDTLKQTVVINS